LAQKRRVIGNNRIWVEDGTSAQTFVNHFNPLQVPSMKFEIPVVTRTQDNGDGGFTTYAYNNEDELLADHPMSEGGDAINGKWVRKRVELTQEQRDEILNEEDPYNNGYIGKDTIKIEVVDGVARLTSPISFHAGQ
jgi:hypothetical protein